MNQNSKISAPNVHLFAFHLWDALGFDSNSPVNSQQPALTSSSNSPVNPEHLWQKCNEILQNNLKVDAELNSSNLYSAKTAPPGWRVNLIVENSVNDLAFLPFEKNIEHHSQPIFLQGFAQPQRIDDSYALGFNISIPEEIDGIKTSNVDVSIFQELNPSNCLLPNSVNSYFGQTLLLTAWLSAEQNQEMGQDEHFLKSLAQQCLENFISGQNLPTFYRQSELFGSPILEYGNPNQQASYCHILILFLNSPATDEIWDAARYSDFMELFLYRNKILRAFWESRAYYREIREDYEKIELDIDNTFKYLQRDKAQQKQSKGAGLKKEELKSLQTQMIEMPPRAVKYARMLIDLEFRQNTIAINAQNYQDKLNKISVDLKARNKYNDSDINLSFLETFSKETCPQFQRQIQADLGYFKHGSGLLDQATEAIRAIVAIEEAYRDAKLEVTIQAVGFGLGVAGVVAGSSPYLIKQDPPNQMIALPLLKVGINSFAFVLLISIGAGALVWGGVLLLANCKNLLGKFKNLLTRNKQLPPP
ncbi:hypothetical protein QUA13_29240 [Microcoleus sp. S28C3]|uniref:hypothetical protein n=1 Tax=Microcoleus sp. S28C3 TaxID=3055414 RepID=UPI002FD0292D